jgi:hypothetical protein
MWTWPPERVWTCFSARSALAQLSSWRIKSTQALVRMHTVPSTPESWCERNFTLLLGTWRFHPARTSKFDWHFAKGLNLADRVVWLFGYALCGRFVATENLLKYEPMRIRWGFLKIGQSTNVEYFSLSGQSEESKCVEGNTLYNETVGKTERIRNADARGDTPNGREVSLMERATHKKISKIFLLCAPVSLDVCILHEIQTRTCECAA